MAAHNTQNLRSPRQLREEQNPPRVAAARRAVIKASRTVGNPGHGHPDSGEVVFLCIASSRVNFRCPADSE
jgi:hypothetical protein